MVIFATIFEAGFAVLLTSLVFGHDADAHVDFDHGEVGHGPSIFSFLARSATGQSIRRNAPVRIAGKSGAVVTGGRRISKPIIEDVQFLDLTEISLPQIRVENMPNTNGVLVTVEAVANIRFQDDAQSLPAAGSRFLGMANKHVQSIARETLEANLRSVVGTLSVDQLTCEREAFRQRVLRKAGEDLARLGMQIDVCSPQSITDKLGCIEALGKKRTAEVKRDTTIGQPEALAEAKKRSTATELQKVVVAEVTIEEERSRAHINVEQQNILREQKSQEAMIVVPAKAKADA